MSTQSGLGTAEHASIRAALCQLEPNNRAAAIARRLVDDGFEEGPVDTDPVFAWLREAEARRDRLLRGETAL